MDKKELFNFPLLNFQLQSTKNYIAWAFTMQSNFRAFGVWSSVEGILKYPSTATQSLYASALDSQSYTTSAVTQHQWVHTDEQIMAYIMRSVSILLRLSIGRSTSYREQW